jgi:hypothetical protein
MFLFYAELMRVVVDARALQVGLFIGGQWWFTGEIFSRREPWFYMGQISTAQLPSY